MKASITADVRNSLPKACSGVNAAGNPAISFPFEPKSVLDLRGSPSSITDGKTTPNALEPLCNGTLPLEEDHGLVNHDMDDWDSLMKELGLHDDLISVSENDQIAEVQCSNLPEFSPCLFDSVQFAPSCFSIHADAPSYASLPRNPPAVDVNTCNWNIGFDCVDELIRLAECFETNSYQLGNVLLGRLNQRLRFPAGKPLQRAAFYFKQALQSLITGSFRLSRPASSSDIIQTIKAQKIFSVISPIPLFSSFTSNQAILDSLDGSMQVHIIDFDIGFGDRWASFMKELTDKANSSKSALPSIRISAIVPEDYAVESRLIRENFCQFAHELNISFDMDFVLIRTFESLLFNSIKFNGEKVAVLLSPAVLRYIGIEFITDLRRVSPDVVVLVDAELRTGSGSPSYRQTVIDGLEYCATLLESMEATNYNGGGDWLRRIESFVVFPKIVESVANVGNQTAALKAALVAAGFTQVRLSQFAEFEAECLVRRLQVEGFNVLRKQGEMALCWRSRPLVAMSAWAIHALSYDDQMYVAPS